MRRIRRWIGNLGVLAALFVGVAVLAVLPAPAAAGLAAVLAAWLLLSRRGRQVLSIAGIGIGSLRRRLGASAVIVFGIAGVVGVLVALLAMGEGFRRTLAETGRTDTAIIFRGGSLSETGSVIGREQIPLILTLPGIAQGPDGRPMAAAELLQVITLAAASDGADANALLRGTDADIWRVRPNVELIAGRGFNAGLRELVVGAGAKKQFRGVDVGRQLRIGQLDWTIVGVFAGGGTHDSELWADSRVVASAYHHPAHQSVTVKLDDADTLPALQAALEADPKLKLEAQSTRDYYGRQSEGLVRLARILGTVIGVIMALGAIFAAVNTMHAAVAARAREIATLRALGFDSSVVVVAVMLEAMLLAVAGGLLGAAVAWLAFNGHSVSTLGRNFNQVAFALAVSPELLWTGLKWTLAMGLIGGLLPALRAARMTVTTALRGN